MVEGGFWSKLWQSGLSVAKVLLRSKWFVSLPKVSGNGAEIVVLGNGPSLATTMQEDADFLQNHELFAVNFFANAPQFMQLQPRYYVLADPLFFTSPDLPNVKALWEHLHGATWEITLFVPAGVRMSGRVRDYLRACERLRVVRYNMTPVEGFDWLENLCFRGNLGMPRPRNVLIPALMLAVNMGYRAVYVAGADHSWTRTLSVDDDNHVVSVQPHFYKDDEGEEHRQRVDYMKYPLHQILYSFYVAFRSYFAIERYSQSRGITIYNVTPGSFIDAFRRKSLKG